MQRWQPLVLGLGVMAAALAGARADAPAFDVKPGLWQVTTSGNASGGPSLPPDALAQMTPEQRAQVEAALRGAMARATAPRTIRSCITAEQLRRNPDFTRGGKTGCRQTAISRTASEIELHEACSGGNAGTMSATIHFSARDRETISGTTLVTQNNGGQPMTVRQQIVGKWLGPDCGSIKPGEPQ
jgi:hypothetical protein